VAETRRSWRDLVALRTDHDDGRSGVSVRFVGAIATTSSSAAWAMPTTIGALPVEAIVKAGMRWSGRSIRLGAKGLPVRCSGTRTRSTTTLLLPGEMADGLFDLASR
jgi:hypothetical protein